MELRDINEIKAAIKYMDFKPVLLSKFYDIKSLLLKEILEDEAFYKIESIMPNPLNDNKIVKCVNILDAKFTKGKEKVDCIKTPASIPAKAIEILDNVELSQVAGSLYLSVDKEFTADVYINIPRGNSTSISNVGINGNVNFEIMNAFNTYVSEGFTLCFRLDDMCIAIEPSALEGIKGQGDVFVYVMDSNAIYKDVASKYFDASKILDVYRG